MQSWRPLLSGDRLAHDRPVRHPSGRLYTGRCGAAMTTAKTGAEHIKSLKDGRTVYIDGKLVDDVTEHPAFRNSVRSAAALYDFQARDENIEAMTFLPDGANRRVKRCWQLPRS